MAGLLRSSPRLIKGAFRLEASSFLTTKSTNLKLFHSSAVKLNIDTDFAQAKERLNQLAEDPGNEVKLKLYALFKQANSGQCNTSRPSAMNFVGRAKWDAWNGLGSISQDEAKTQYISVVEDLGGTPTPQSSPESNPTSASEDLVLTKDGKMGIIRLNRPDKKNALKTEMYTQIAELLQNIADDPSCSIAVLTGTGDYYCSGNDLSNFMNISGPEDMKRMAQDGGQILNQFVASFIDFPKPLIALVNGPSVGVSCTTLALCDLVYCTDRATFNTPFSSLGQTPEGCSTYLFPKIMGQSKANEMLMFEKKLMAQEAFDRGLVAQVFPDSDFQTQAWAKVKAISELPPQTMRFSKQLIQGVSKDILHSVNNAECERLVERWQSQECMNAIMGFFTKKSKM